jgi:hypothetical protein
MFDLDVYALLLLQAIPQPGSSAPCLAVRLLWT